MKPGGANNIIHTMIQTWTLAVKEKQAGLYWQGPDMVLQASFDAEWEIGENGAENGASPLYGEWAFEERSLAQLPEAHEGGGTLISDRFVSGGLEVIRQVRYCPDDPSHLDIRLTARNRSEGVLQLHRLIPLIIEGKESLQLGGIGAADWVLYRSGRQKNDLPSVCVLGRDDEAFRDALTGLSESGKHSGEAAVSPSSEIVSDELTVIAGGSGTGSASLLLGFTGGAEQLAECRLRMNASRQSLERLEAACLLDGVLLQPGESREGEWIRLDGKEPFEAVERFVKAKKQQSGSSAAANPPSVFCTWYYYGDTVSQEDVYGNLEALQERSIPVDVIQIDEGWEIRFGNWEANHRFPDGMEAVARRIGSAGFRPGIWTAPFLVEPRSDMRFYHDDWLLKDHDGEPVKFYMNQTDNLVWDVTHPEVQAWIVELYRKLTRWGYTYHKLDFTRAVAMSPNVKYHNPSVTRAQAYRMGIEAVRQGIGEDGYLLICGGLFSAPAGLADAHRTSSDVLSMWSERKGRQGGKVAPYTIKQNVLRYWMNRLWHNDPDALMVRRNETRIRSLDLSLGLLTDEEAHITALNQYWGGGLVCFTEPVAEIDADRIGLLRHLTPAIGEAAVPRDMYQGKQYNSVFDVEIDRRDAGLGKWHTVSVVNWSDEPSQAAIKLDKELLGAFAEEHTSFAVTEFWSGRIWGGIQRGQSIDLGELAAHSSCHLKIVPESAVMPIVLYTNGHFSMGGAEIKSMTRKGKEITLSIDWQWEYPLNITLRSPAGSAWADEQKVLAGWKHKRDVLQLSFEGKFTGIISLYLK